MLSLAGLLKFDLEIQFLMSACEIRGEDSGILRKIGDIWVHSELQCLGLELAGVCRRE